MAYPDQEVVVAILYELRRMIFPEHFSGKKMFLDVRLHLQHEIERALMHQRMPFEGDVYCTSVKITDSFLAKIDDLRDILSTDAEAGFDGDPAAYSVDEVILVYPGFFAILVQRIAHELFLKKVPLIPRMMCEYAHEKTGIDIHPGATIGRYFFIDHGTGVVIGETTVIGEHVKLYQGVTLGALSTKDGQMSFGKARHPKVEDNVTIYAGTAILGGDTVIGTDSIIGGNTFITTTVPPKSKVKGARPTL